MIKFICDTCAEEAFDRLPTKWLVHSQLGLVTRHFCGEECRASFVNGRPEGDVKKVMYTIYPTPEQHEKLTKLSETTKRRAADYVREGIDLLLKSLNPQLDMPDLLWNPARHIKPTDIIKVEPMPPITGGPYYMKDPSSKRWWEKDEEDDED